MKKVLSTFIVLWVFWVFLSGIDVSNLIIGGIASIIIAVIITRYVDYSFDYKLPVKLAKFTVIYIPVFILKLILANFDMAYRVLSPKLPIRPGFVKIPVQMNSDFGKLILANSITLTPGTLTLDVEEDEMLVHWINVKGNKSEDYRTEICGGFHEMLGGIFND